MLFQIEIFTLQLQHRKMGFSACGFFKLDFALIYSVTDNCNWQQQILTLMSFQSHSVTALDDSAAMPLDGNLRSNINFNALLSIFQMVGAVTTYIVVLMQFHPHKTGTCFSNQTYGTTILDGDA